MDLLLAGLAQHCSDGPCEVEVDLPEKGAVEPVRWPRGDCAAAQCRADGCVEGFGSSAMEDGLPWLWPDADVASANLPKW